MGFIGPHQSKRTLAPFFLGQSIVNVMRGHQSQVHMMMFFVVPGEEITHMPFAVDERIKT